MKLDEGIVQTKKKKKKGKKTILNYEVETHKTSPLIGLEIKIKRSIGKTWNCLNNLNQI